MDHWMFWALFCFAAIVVVFWINGAAHILARRTLQHRHIEEELRRELALMDTSAPGGSKDRSR